MTSATARGAHPRLAAVLPALLAGLLLATGCATVEPTATAPTLSSTSASGPSSTSPSAAAPVSHAAPTVIWSDDFDGPADSLPDPGKWTPAVGGGGWGNSELQYYTNKPANAALDGHGHLVITARAGGGGHWCWYGRCRFTSARVTTHKKFSHTYGKFEARIKLPRGRGVWSAFWLLGENIDEVGYPAAGEIDIMENIGQEPNKVIGALHGPSPQLVFPYEVDKPFADDFHVFAVDWTPNHISFSVDGHTHRKQPRRVLGWVYDHPFHIILNIAVGGHWPGEPDHTTEFPQSMLVDYVRVSSRDV